MVLLLRNLRRPCADLHGYDGSEKNTLEDGERGSSAEKDDTFLCYQLPQRYVINGEW